MRKKPTDSKITRTTNDDKVERTEMPRVQYCTRIKSLSAKNESDSITIEGKDFNHAEREQLIAWIKSKELLLISIQQLQPPLGFGEIKKDTRASTD